MTSNKNILGKLANPIFFQEDLKNEDKFSNKTLQKFYSKMFRIREAEKIIALLETINIKKIPLQKHFYS